ncbi:MAG: 4-hydroxybenzoate octaprenyltransferase, partial [Thermoanaerobaculia bacterium]
MRTRAAAVRGGFRQVGVFLEMIKISHSVFALPFAVAALFIAVGGWPSPLLLLQVALAVVLARTAAMSFNRWADAALD